MAYAKRLTKERLIQEGFTEITKEGRLFKGEQEIFPHWISNKTTGAYLGIIIYKRDPEGHLIKGKDRVIKYTRKDGTIRESITWNGIPETFGLHRVMWAWHYGEVPEGMVVDHIDNKHSKLEDYKLDNLQLLTPKENLTKERVCNVKELKCKMNKPRKFYEDKLSNYEALYEEAKANHDADACHQLRTNIANTRARLRYWDAHENEYTKGIIKLEKEKAEHKQNVRDRMLLKEYKRIFKEYGNKAMWHETCKVIKNWDTFNSIQKEHVFEVLHNLFTRYDIEEPKI